MPKRKNGQFQRRSPAQRQKRIHVHVPMHVLVLLHCTRYIYVENYMYMYHCGKTFYRLELLGTNLT